MRKGIFLATLLVFSALTVFSTSPVHGAAVTADPGDTVWYDVTTFKINFEALAGGNLGADFPLDSVLDLSTSEIYVKVMAVGETLGTYWDPRTSTMVSGNVPVVDVTAGAILGAPVDFDLNGTTITMPQGMAIPINFIFSSVTMFNVSMPAFPFPIFLSDDFDLHEAVIQAAINDPNTPSGISVVNDAAQFRISATNVNLNDGGSSRIDLNGAVTWSKPDGMLNSIDMTITNRTSGLDLIDIAFSFKEKVHNGLFLSVGDKFDIIADSADFSFTTSDANVSQGLSEAKNELNALEGKTVISMEVTDINGLYYQVDAKVYNSTTGTMDPVPEPIWFAGFGRLPFDVHFGTSLLLNMGAPDAGFMTGPVVTTDYQIFAAWDLTHVFELSVVGTVGEQIAEAILAEDSVLHFDYSSSPSFTSGPTDDGGYSTKVDADLNFALEANSSDTDGFTEWWNYVNIVFNSSVSFRSSMNIGGHLNDLSLTGEMHVDATSIYHEADLGSGATIIHNEMNFLFDITDFNLTLSVSSTLTPDTQGFLDNAANQLNPTNTTAGGNNSTTGSAEPSIQNPLPGFEGFIAFAAMLMVAPVLRRKK
ncbi:MAG: hypothetical protein D6732_25580 [Methanobacteriota archaeon]|nr:MAG: hypothetical protein D6732_25580 [Euryarchaeota archaeon]